MEVVLTVLALVERRQVVAGLQGQLLQLVGHRLALRAGRRQPRQPRVPPGLHLLTEGSGGYALATSRQEGSSGGGGRGWQWVRSGRCPQRGSLGKRDGEEVEEVQHYRRGRPGYSLSFRDFSGT